MSMSCGFIGNADIYGVGIRIGYYTQAIAVWFSNYFLYREAKSLRATNNIFLLALTIAATIYFVHASTTYAVEAFLMLQIGLVIGLVGITEISRYSSKYVRTSQERLLLRMFTIMAGGLFNVCFWWREVNLMLPTPCNDHDTRNGSKDETYMFFFAKARLYGWVGILSKVMSLWALVWTAPRIVTIDTVVLLYNDRMKASRAAFVSAVESSTSVHGRGRQLGSDRLQKHSIKVGSVPMQGRSALDHPQVSGSVSQVENSNSENTLQTSGERKDNFAVAHTDKVRKDVELLKSIEHALGYIEDLFSIYATNTPATGKKRLVRICGSIPMYLPHYESHCTDTFYTYSQCCWTTLKSYFTNKPPFHLRWRLAIHMTASGQHPIWRWPRLVHRMYILGEASKPPDWRHVSIASDILLTQIPLVIESRRWVSMAAYQLLFIILLIVQVELTIVWNHVSGLQSLSSLGQLIPFIIGVGSLIKVLWGKWRSISRGLEDRRFEEEGDYEKAMAIYVERRQTPAKRSVVRAATA